MHYKGWHEKFDEWLDSSGVRIRPYGRLKPLPRKRELKLWRVPGAGAGDSPTAAASSGSSGSSGSGSSSSSGGSSSSSGSASRAWRGVGKPPGPSGLGTHRGGATAHDLPSYPDPAADPDPAVDEEYDGNGLAHEGLRQRQVSTPPRPLAPYLPRPLAPLRPSGSPS